MIEMALEQYKPKFPRIMSSFGKDSLAVIDLAAQFGIRDVLYIQDLDEVYDEEYIKWVVDQYQLTVTRCGLGRAMFLPFPTQPLLLAFPYVNWQCVTPIPTTMRRWEGEGRYVCLDDELRTTRGVVTPVDTDFILIGYKLADVEKATCPVPQDFLSQSMRDARRDEIANRGPVFDLAPGLPAVAPLFWWSDTDTWDYLERNSIPVSPLAYRSRTKVAPTTQWCTRCHDPAGPSKTWCPKVQADILNTAALSNPLPSRIAELVDLGVLTPDEGIGLMEIDDG